MKKISEVRENVGMKNPYALADHLAAKYKKQKKEWDKMILGMDPINKDPATALYKALFECFKLDKNYEEWINLHWDKNSKHPKKNQNELFDFDPENPSPIYENQPIRRRG